MPLEKLRIKNLDNGRSSRCCSSPTDTVDDSKWQEQQGNRRRRELQYAAASARS
jgi:hypothetical protein